MVWPQICSAMNSRSISHGEGLAHAHVVEGGLGGVHDEVPGAEIRAEAGPDPEALLERLHLVGRHVVGGVELAGLVAAHHGGEVRGREVVDRVDLDVLGVVVVLVLGELDVGVRHELDELVGAVRHHVARLHEVLAELLDRGLVDRQAGLVGQQLDEVGGRLLEGDLDGLGRRRPSRRVPRACPGPC